MFKHPVRVISVLLIALPALVLLGFCMGLIGETAQVAQDEFGPRAALQKYERFKDMSAQLDAKVADIEVFGSRIKTLDAQYQGLPRREWPRDDRENHNLWTLELAGLKASYNRLAAEYNADMSKFNYRFANQGDLPAGATHPLPREYKPYVLN